MWLFFSFFYELNSYFIHLYLIFSLLYNHLNYFFPDSLRWILAHAFKCSMLPMCVCVQSLTRDQLVVTPWTHGLQPPRLFCPWNSPGKNTGVICHFLLLLSRFSRVRLCATPQTAAHQAPPSLGVSRQEHWSGLPFPSPTHESDK